jgi:quercetin dioxygenase-like cupin family protein
MASDYLFFDRLTDQAPPPPNGILSKTVHADDRIKAVLFGFAPGEELSEHTASMPAIMHFLEGEADVTVGGDSMQARPGTWFHMQPNLKHSIVAKTPVSMLLLLLKNPPKA